MGGGANLLFQSIVVPSKKKIPVLKNKVQNAFLSEIQEKETHFSSSDGYIEVNSTETAATTLRDGSHCSSGWFADAIRA